jgi:hypothetical protein
MVVIRSGYAGLGINTVDGAYVPLAPATIETRADAIAAEVKRGDVDPALVEETERTVRSAARSLGLDPAPRVRWLPASTKNIRGVTFDDTLSEIWVRVQDRERARDTALHELRHVWQLQPAEFRWLLPGLKTMAERQADADHFAATWTWDMPAPVTASRQVAAHAQPAGGDRHGAGGSERGRQIWEEKYAPLHEAARQYVAERQARWPRRARW